MQNINPKEYQITLDTKRGHRVPLINITEGDTNSAVFHIKLTEQGKKVYIPDNAVVLLYFAKNDDTKTVQSTLDGSTFVVDGEIVCELKTNSIGVSDTTQVEVKVLTHNNGMLVTPTKFKFNVIDTIVCDEDIESSNEYPLLVELIKKIEEIEWVAQSTFGKSDIIKIKSKQQYVTPVVTVYSSGFGDGGFGGASFGGDDLTLERCKVVYSGEGVISIQPNDNYNGLEVEDVEQLSEKRFVATYKNADTKLHIFLSTGGEIVEREQAD